jgi:23S rRNA (adenine2030-N6)-methyltransferase
VVRNVSSPARDALVNYRHRFHAGNVADVFKHIVLVRVLEALRAKDTPFCVIDTHAGSGLYRLAPPGEYQQGIGRLWPERRHWSVLEPYFTLLAHYNREALHAYPGSPLLIAQLLRPQDRAVFIERHPDEVAALADNLGDRRGIAIHEADGFAMLKAVVPPRENRGLVFIDPPYEQPGEFEQVADSLRAAFKRWRNGIYGIWYPIKQRAPVERLHAAVRALETTAWAVEFLTLPEDVPQRLNGSGVILVNPPYRLDQFLRDTLPPLAELLAPPHGRPRARIVDLTAAGNPEVS